MDEDVFEIGGTSVRKSIVRNATILLVVGALGFVTLNSWLRLAMEEYYASAYRAELARTDIEPR